ncbi:hypothetical protein LJC14_03755, partial [Treponema sp. OttesenSCG-928-L16]|nr:hypothetical protein [Treponema sp. OttesenSCG-928-L16]
MHIIPFRLSFPDEHKCMRFPFLFDARECADMVCAVSGRAAPSMYAEPGTDSREQNAFLEGQGLDPDNVYSCTQIHSKTVFAVDRHIPNTRPEGDGLVSRDEGLVLSVT